MTYIFKFSSKSYLSAGFLVLFAFAISGCGGGDGGHNCQKICSTGSVLSLTWPNKSKDWCIRKSASASCKWYYAGEPLGNYDFFYRDSDSDGFGNPDATKIALSQPDGYVSNSRDCNDSNADINPGATEVTDGVDNNCDGRVDEIPYYADSDGDLFGNPGDIKAALSQPIGYVPDNTDCNDANAAINPAAIEIGDSIDNNCDGQVDEGFTIFYRDNDGDSYGDTNDIQITVSQPAGYVPDNTDCNDSNAAIHPGATELGDSIDNNCDGQVDEGFSIYYLDFDADGFGDINTIQIAALQPSGFVLNYADCNDSNNFIFPETTELIDGVDNNCNGYIDEISGSIPLNDTGITWGANYPDGHNASCIGETIGQQDCSQGRDAQTLVKTGAGSAGFDFTKLDSGGTPLVNQAQNYATNPWACVRDNHTGLTWEVKTDDGGIHDKDKTYKWGGKTARLTGVFGTRFDDWDALVDGSNSEVLCGFSDWRVPSRKELRSIVDYSGVSPSVDFAYFPTIRATPPYWSASPAASNSSSAWRVSFLNGGVGGYSRTYAHPVMLVRNEP